MYVKGSVNLGMNGVKKLFFLHLRFWAILIGSVAAGIVLFIAGVYIACAIDPPYTEEGYALMPIGQAFIGLLVGVAGGIVLFVYLLRKNRHYFK